MAFCGSDDMALMILIWLKPKRERADFGFVTW